MRVRSVHSLGSKLLDRCSSSLPSDQVPNVQTYASILTKDDLVALRSQLLLSNHYELLLSSSRDRATDPLSGYFMVFMAQLAGDLTIPWPRLLIEIYCVLAN